MSIQDAAAAAASTFPFVNVPTPYGTFSLPVLMTAIAGAETGGTFDDASPGDYGLGGPSCGGATSWGLWQVHNVHSNLLTQLSGSTDPCQWAAWLADPMNCARAAMAVYQSQGLGAWTTWQEGTYSGWLQPAVQAVTAAVAATSGPGGGGTSGSPQGSPSPLWAVGLAAVVFGGSLVGIHRAARRRLSATGR
ncbi:MAG: hypothetical protein ACYCT1_08490 [Steroidobacteraceae bacterium]